MFLVAAGADTMPQPGRATGLITLTKQSNAAKNTLQSPVPALGLAA